MNAKITPDEARQLRERAIECIRSNRIDEAVVALEALIARVPDDVPACWSWPTC